MLRKIFILFYKKKKIENISLQFYSNFKALLIPSQNTFTFLQNKTKNMSNQEFLEASETGDLEAVQRLLKSNEININIVT